MYLRTLIDFLPASGLPAYRSACRNRANYTPCRFTVRSLPVFALWWVLAANHASAASITAFYGDDNNTSTTGGQPGIFFSCPWITAGEQSFMADNAGWDFTYAGAAASAFLLNDLTVVSYYPWVVNQPTYSRTFTNPDGTTTTRTWGGTLNGEAGGAYIRLAYTPHGTDPVNIRWIQGVNANYYGRGFDGGHLDNPGDRTSPFYDVGSQDLAGSTYFVDIPGAPENEYEGNPVASVDFQAFVATDNLVNGVHKVTVYGGVWWGYTYTAMDAQAPEPSSLGMMGSGLILLGFIGSRKFFQLK